MEASCGVLQPCFPFLLHLAREVVAERGQSLVVALGHGLGAPLVERRSQVTSPAIQNSFELQVAALLIELVTIESFPNG